MANQYTKAEEEGREKPVGQNQFTTKKRERHDEETRDKMRAAKAAAKLEAIMDDPNSTKADQIAASKELMRYGKITADRKADGVIEIDDETPEALLERLRALITAHPGLIKQLNLSPAPCAVATNKQSTDVTHQDGVLSA